MLILNNNLMNKKIIALCTATLLALPMASLADTTPIGTPSNVSTCINLTMNLKMTPSNDATVKTQISALQSALASEGFSITSTEVGTFGVSTKAAVKSFQEKYKDDVLTPFGYTKGTGNMGTLTRLKLMALYGCRTHNVNPAANYSGPVNLSITNLTLDSSGVTGTFCNNGKADLPIAQFRVRLNGINRDFDEPVQKAGTCVTDTWLYSTWGLNYDPGVTFGAVVLIDPNNFYKSGQLQYPSTPTANITVPALPGYHLAVRGVSIKSTGVQATVCNLGTINMTSFPIAIKFDGTSKNFDVPEVYAAGKCVTKNFTYDNWGATSTAGVAHSVTIIADPNNIFNETDEFDGIATTIGTP
jgi:hypothetical protein